MNSLERLLNNMKLFLEVGGEEYTKQVFDSFLEEDKTIDSIDELNDLMETEISYWEE